MPNNAGGVGWTLIPTVAFILIYFAVPPLILLYFRGEEISSTCSEIASSPQGLITLAVTLIVMFITQNRLLRHGMRSPAIFLLAALTFLALLRYFMDVSSLILWDTQLMKQTFPLSGKVAVVTGANKGIGFEAAKMLAVELGAHVILTCRTKSRCHDAVAEVNEAAQASRSGGSARSMALELASLESVKELVDELNADEIVRERGIHLLFNHAGIMPGEKLTNEGLEDGFGGLHITHMALTLGALPLLEKGATGSNIGPSRVVITTSDSFIFSLQSTTGDAFHASLFEGDGEGDLRGEITYAKKEPFGMRRMHAYSRAKLANVLFCFELNRRLRAKYSDQPSPLVIAHTFHPGAVVTTCAKDAAGGALAAIPGLDWIATRIFIPLLFRSPRGGARVLLFAGLGENPPIMRHGGTYINGMGQPVVSSLENSTAHSKLVRVLQADQKYSGRLWDVSLRLIRDSPARRVAKNAP